MSDGSFCRMSLYVDGTDETDLSVIIVVEDKDDKDNYLSMLLTPDQLDELSREMQMLARKLKRDPQSFIT